MLKPNPSPPDTDCPRHVRSGGIMRAILRAALWSVVIGLFVLVGRATPTAAAGPFAISPVASLTMTLPPTVITPNTQNYMCLVRTDYPGSGYTIPATVLCYSAAQPAAAPPPPPPPYQPPTHLQFTATINQATGHLTTAIIPCLYFDTLSPPTALRITLSATLSKAGTSVSGTVAVLQNSTSSAPVIYCADGSTTTSPLTLTPLPQTHDEDLDGCPDWAELGPDQTAGGLRDPFNMWDYFNPANTGIVLSGDITLEVNHYGHTDSEGPPNYGTKYDRGGVIAGANKWNLQPPDGIILSADITAAVDSYGHACGSGIN